MYQKQEVTNITLGGGKLKLVQEFCYLGSSITEDTEAKGI